MLLVSRPLSRDLVSSLASEMLGGKCALICGAGVSMVEPSLMPSGAEFLGSAVRSVVTDSRLVAHLDRLLALPQFRRLVPELIFQRIFDIVGYLPLEPFDVFRWTEPNLLHRVLANAAISGLPILTTNFDRLLSMAGADGQASPLHLHGHIDEPDTLVATIRDVGKGIRGQALDDALRSLRVETIIVLGYSGNDLDVMEILAASEAKHIRWVVRTSVNRATENIAQWGFTDRVECLVGDLADLALKLEHLIGATPRSAYGVDTEATSLPADKRDASFLRQSEVLVGCLLQIEEYQSSVDLVDEVMNFDTNEHSDRASLLCLKSFALERLDMAERALEAALGAERELPDESRPELVCRVHTEAGLAALGLRDPDLDLARHHLDAALVASKQVAPDGEVTYFEGRARHNLGYWFEKSSDFASALSEYQTALAIKREVGELTTVATGLRDVASMLVLLGRDHEATEPLTEFLAIAERYSLNYEVAWYHYSLGLHLAARGDKTEAALELIEAKRIFKESLRAAGMVLQIDEQINALCG